MQYHSPTPLYKILFFLQTYKTKGITQLQDSPFPFFTDRLQPNIQSYKISIIYYIIIVQLTVTIKITLSYFLNQTLAQLPSLQYPIILAVAFPLQVIFEMHYFQNIYQLSHKIRQTISQQLFAKLQSTTLTRIQEVSKGQFFNIISMDLSDLDLTWILAFSGAPIIAVIGLYLLFTYFGPSALIGIITLAIIMYLQRYTTALTGPLKQEKNQLQDQRTKLTEEVLNNLKALKMYAIEFLYRDTLLQQRDKQDKKTQQILNFDALAYSLNGNLNVFISLLAMLSVYSLSGNQLNSESIFSSIWILQLIKVWCITYGQRAYKAVINLRVLQKRVNDILDIQDLNEWHQIKTNNTQQKKKKYLQFKEEDYDEELELQNLGIQSQESQSQSESKSQQQQQKPQQEQESNFPSIQLINYTGYWNKLQEMSNKPVLNRINLSIQKPQLIVIYGRVGQSKSSLFQAILHELPYHSGNLQIKGHIAYVEQNPYVFPGTIQDNITFGSPFNQDHYTQVLQLSALVNDNIASDFDVGENGCNLSGGQKARVSLARAFYSDADIYLLDDILSAVDNNVSNTLINSLTLIKNQGKIIFLITHKNIKADLYLKMQDGLIELQEQVQNIQENIIEIKEEQIQKIQVNQEIDTTSTDDNIYKQYLKEGGSALGVLIMILYLLDAILSLKIINLFGYGHILYPFILIFPFFVINYLKFRLNFGFTIRVINSLHRKLLTSVVRCQIKQLSNVGLFLSRFTSDLNNIETMVMLDLHWVIEGLIDNVFVIIFVSLNKEIIIISFLFLLAMFYIKQKFHPIMKYCLEQDDITRANLYSKLQSSITGLTLIRAYSQQSNFCEAYLNLAYANMRAQFSFLRLNALLAFIIEMSLHILIVIVMFLLLVSGRDKETIGFSLLMLMQLGYMFSLNLRGQIYLDIDMQNVRRLYKTIAIPVENYTGTEINQWPTQGQIQFKNIYMSYGHKVALNNVSFEMSSGQSLGIIGRTGAGKSSIINALFRLFPIQSGSILIDGINISEISLNQLRESIIVIPQNCPLFNQSIRYNLDPREQYSNPQLWSALSKVGLQQIIEQFPNGLDEVNYTLSAGQRQLLGLSRVFLDKSKKIIVFDEATSNIDQQSENGIEEVLNSIKVTKIIIAHRLNMVMNCDKILTLKDGEVFSIESPKILS